MKLLLILLIPLFFTGCTHDLNRKEIDEIDLIQVIGIDASENGYTISALYNTMGGVDEESGAGEGKAVVVKGEGNTIYAAYEDLKLKNKKAISIAHTSFFLIGDEAARKGIDGFIDFLSRDETIMMESLIYITKDYVASEFLEEGIENELQINYDLEAINQKQAETITRNDNTLVNMVNGIRKNSYASLLIPYLLVEENSFLIEGYAVIDQYKLVDYLDNETSSGINFIKNIIRSYPIYIDEVAGLSLSYNVTKLTSKLTDKGVSVVIEVNFETTIKEVMTKENLFTQEKLEDLTRLQNGYIRTVLEKPVNYSQTTGSDVLDIARLVENQHVKEWKEYEESWSDYITEIDYEIIIHSKITKSFLIGNEVKNK